MKKLALLTSREHPKLIADEAPLLAALEAEAIEPHISIWNDQTIDWTAFDAVLIRTVWDYYRHLDLFLKVLSSINSRGITILNSLPCILWNIDKRYLVELERKGAPVIPSVVVQNPSADSLAYLLQEHEWQEAVIKPAVGAGATEMVRLSTKTIAPAIEQLRTLTTKTRFVVQPFVEAVVSEGEYTFVFFDNKFVHAVRKKPGVADFRVQEEWGGTTELLEPHENDLKSAIKVLEHIPHEWLYARIDMVRGKNGELQLMEAELIEPEFFFRGRTASADLLAAAIKRRLL